jgi:hypothetical protein
MSCGTKSGMNEKNRSHCVKENLKRNKIWIAFQIILHTTKWLELCSQWAADRSSSRQSLSVHSW